MANVTALLPAALSGDRESQNELFKLVEPELRQLAWHWLLRYSAQERVQVSDVLDRVFMKLMKIDSPDWKHRGQFYAFACRNIPSVLIDLFRAQDRERRQREQGDQQALMEGVSNGANGLTDSSLISLRQALVDLEQQLSPLHREIVELKFIGEFTLDDISELVSVPRSTVDYKLNVALAFLRHSLKASFPDLERLS